MHEREPFQPIDANFFNLDSPTSQQAIGSLCFLDSCPDLELLKERISRLPEIFPRLKKRIDSSHGLAWVEVPSFNLNDHLTIVVDSSICSIEDIHKRASNFFSDRINFAHSPWKIGVFSNGLPQSDPNGQHAILIMIHHALGDGLGGFEIVNALSDTQRQQQHEKSSELPSSQKHHHRYLAVKPLSLLKKLKSLLLVLGEECSARAKSPFNGENSSARVVSHIELPLKDLRSLKKQLSCSLNNLFLLLVSMATRRYLSLQSAPTKDLRAVIPVNIRKAIARHELGNHITGVGMLLPTSENNPKDQLFKIIKRSSAIFESGLYGAYGVLGQINFRLPLSIQPTLCRFQAHRTNFICTNIPGPRSCQYIAGAKVTRNLGLAALMPGQGVAVSFLSYLDNAYLTIVADPNIVSDLPALLSCFRQASSELLGSLT